MTLAMNTRRNINRGYMKLVVWQDAKAYDGMTLQGFRDWSYELKRVAANQIACVDSIHRNIAEGYARRSLKEYLHFLNIALASTAESVSSLHAYREAEQLTVEQFDALDSIAYKIENGLLRLIQRLQERQCDGAWSESFIVRESNAAYSADHGRSRSSNIPTT